MSYKNLKRILILLILLIILLLIFIAFIKYSNSKLYIKNLMNKGIKNINFIEEYSDKKKYVKENIEKVVYDNGDIYYNNYENGESIIIMNEEKKIYLSTNLNENSGTYKSIYYNILDQSEVLQIKKDNLNDNKYIVVELSSNKSEKNSYLLEEVWINEDLGIIEKIIYYNVKNGKKEVLNETEYNMHTNIVTDEEISKPNINNYSDFEIINN